VARYFFDSSALVKRYHQEPGTSVIEALFNKNDSRCFASRLALVEVTSAFARYVREGSLAQDRFENLMARMESDVKAKVLEIVAFSSRRLDAAAVLVRTHGLRNIIRTLDAIQLATAQALNTRNRISAFVAADKKLLASAVACNLATLDVS
jgi:predicted nucleic acid-binding protein